MSSKTRGPRPAGRPGGSPNGNPRGFPHGGTTQIPPQATVPGLLGRLIDEQKNTDTARTDYRARRITGKRFDREMVAVGKHAQIVNAMVRVLRYNRLVNTEGL